MNSFGRKLQYCRVLVGISAKEMATELAKMDINMNQGKYSRWESDFVKIPTVTDILALIKLFKNLGLPVNIDWLSSNDDISNYSSELVNKSYLHPDFKRSSFVTFLPAFRDELFSFLSRNIKNITYQSIALYYGDIMIAYNSNNYNNWGNVFFGLKKYKGCSLMDLKKLKEVQREGFIFWEKVKHTKESTLLDFERKKFNLGLGVSLLFKPKNNTQLTLVTSFTPNSSIRTSTFYREINGWDEKILAYIERLFNKHSL